MSNSVKRIQYLLKLFFPSLSIDGMIGARSRWALRRAPLILRRLITLSEGNDSLLNSVGFSGPELPVEEEDDMRKKNGLLVALDAIFKASASTGVPAAWLMAFARIESNFDSSAQAGSSKGLFQFQRDGWEDAMKAEPKLVRYDEGVWDPYMNALAAATYMLINTRALALNGINVMDNPSLLYMAHQQGVAGMLELYKAAHGIKYSTNYVTEEKMLRNPPPGVGKVTNKVAFYEGWIAHLSPMFA